MALRLRRGLFRLWLVLSVAWIGVVTVIVWQNPPSTSEEIWAHVDPKGRPDFSVLPSERRYSDADAESKFDPSKPYDKFVGYRADWLGAVEIVAVAVFLPPIIVLICGSALFWAIKGFRG